MLYFLALIPATALTIAGYFALYLSNRSEGAFRTFGKYLGFWAFTLAGLVVLGAIFAAAHGGRHWHGQVRIDRTKNLRNVFEHRYAFGLFASRRRPPRRFGHADARGRGTCGVLRLSLIHI